MIKTSLRKIDIAKTLSNKTGFSNNFSKKLIDDFIEVLILVVKEKDLNLKNIGKFNKISKKKRMGRNPKTKEPFLISSRVSIRFVPSRKLIKAINDN